MRTGKELIQASKHFTGENRTRSWFELLITLVLTPFFLTLAFLEEIHLVIRLVSSIITSLLYVRMFVIYHDYQHLAILQRSQVAAIIMQAIGLYLLAPQTIWKRSHDHHHNNNSKLTMTGIGSYPTICKERFLALSKTDQRVYLVNRHPLTVILGYFTLFIYWLNLKSFFQSPKKHTDSFLALVFHFSVGTVIWYYFGAGTFLITWFLPFLLAFGMGSYLFYCQHNFPGAVYCENHDWKYDRAALASTSLMKMNPVMQWFTGNIGFHHVHHLNSRIPFYRLKEAMRAIPELQHVTTTSWNPFEIVRCLKLKLWDPDKQKMITLRELQAD